MFVFAGMWLSTLLSTLQIILWKYTYTYMYRITHMHIALALALTPRFRPGASPLRARVRLFLLAGGRFQLGTTIVLAANGVPPHFRGWWYLDTSVGVDAPTLASLSVAGHVALEHKREKMMRDGRGNGGRRYPKTALPPHLAQHVSLTPTEHSQNEVIIELDAETQNRQKTDSQFCPPLAKNKNWQLQ